MDRHKIISARVVCWTLAMGFLGGFLNTKSAIIEIDEVFAGVTIGVVIGVLLGLFFEAIG